MHLVDILSYTHMLSSFYVVIGIVTFDLFLFLSGFSTIKQKTLAKENQLYANSYNSPIHPTAMPLRPFGILVAS